MNESKIIIKSKIIIALSIFLIIFLHVFRNYLNVYAIEIGYMISILAMFGSILTIYISKSILKENDK